MFSITFWDLIYKNVSDFLFYASYLYMYEDTDLDLLDPVLGFPSQSSLSRETPRIPTRPFEDATSYSSSCASPPVSARTSRKRVQTSEVLSASSDWIRQRKPTPELSLRAGYLKLLPEDQSSPPHPEDSLTQVSDSCDRVDSETGTVPDEPSRTPFHILDYLPQCPNPHATPVIYNSICFARLPCSIDLKTLCCRCRNVDYNPTVSSTAEMTLSEPRASVFCHANGTLRVMGCRTSVAARLAAKRAAKIIREVFQIEFHEFSFSPSNLMAQADIGVPIRLAELAEAHPTACMYEPLIYSGCVMKFENGVRILLYVTGKMVLTGARDMEELRRAFRAFVTYVAPYAKKLS